ncbi:22399_t:CDS:2 [Entrophospora sp. SA101]|nr:22399_t:CDS:2 [Entrophospora sp. SA101]CAJ0823727.1 11967_t:CDS:2 [Entrophospora sp. SA101]
MLDEKSENKTFSIEGKGLKLNTAEDVQEYIDSIMEMENLENVILSGNTFGVEAIQALASALKGKNTIKIVNASDIFTGRLKEEIPDSVKALCDALEDKEIVELNFSDNAFGPAGAEPMTDFLTNNRTLQVLKLNNNGLGVQGGKLIGKALLEAAKKNHEEDRESSLKVFVAGRNRLENGSSQALSDAIAAHNTLVEIRLPQNGIRSEGIIALSKGLAECKNLEIIDLQDNTFTKTGSESFADSLTEWKNLKSLNIGDCLLSQEGGIIIAKKLLLGNNKNLETLNLQYNEIDKQLLEAAKKNHEEDRESSLKVFVAGRNRLENGSSQALSDAIAAHNTLVEIRLPQNGIRSEGIIALSKGLAECKNLEIIDLQDNTFTKTGSESFADSLTEWKNLKSLNIGDCLLSQEGGIIIAKKLLLGNNKNLETLNLQYNEIDKHGISILASAISTHLKKLASLELNGNKVYPDDSSIEEIKNALEEIGHKDALGELDDMEVSDSEEEDVDKNESDAD